MEKLNKVAQITLLFWLMKIVATTLGETLGDYLSMTLNLGVFNRYYSHTAFLFSSIDNTIGLQKIHSYFLLVGYHCYHNVRN